MFIVRLDTSEGKMLRKALRHASLIPDSAQRSLEPDEYMYFPDVMDTWIIRLMETIMVEQGWLKIDKSIKSGGYVLFTIMWEIDRISFVLSLSALHTDEEKIRDRRELEVLQGLSAKLKEYLSTSMGDDDGDGNKDNDYARFGGVEIRRRKMDERGELDTGHEFDAGSRRVVTYGHGINYHIDYDAWPFPGMTSHSDGSADEKYERLERYSRLEDI